MCLARLTIAVHKCLKSLLLLQVGPLTLLPMIFETHLIAIRASCTLYNYSPMCAWPVCNWIRRLKDLQTKSLKCVVGLSIGGRVFAEWNPELHIAAMNRPVEQHKGYISVYSKNGEDRDRLTQASVTLSGVLKSSPSEFINLHSPLQSIHSHPSWIAGKRVKV